MNYELYSPLDGSCNDTERDIFLCGVLKLFNYTKQMEDYYNSSGSYMNDMYMCDNTMYSIEC